VPLLLVDCDPFCMPFMGSVPLKMLGALVWALLLVQTLQATSAARQQHHPESLRLKAAAATSWPPFELDDLGFDLEEKVGGGSERPHRRVPSVMTSTNMNPFADAEPGFSDDSDSLALCQIRLDELEVRVEDLEEQQAKMIPGPAVRTPGPLKLQPDGAANADEQGPAGTEFLGMRTAGPILPQEIPNKMLGSAGSMPKRRPTEERRENPVKRFGQERKQVENGFGLPNRPTKRRPAKKSTKKRPAKKKSMKKRPAKKKSMKKRPAKKSTRKRSAKKAKKKRPTKKRSMKNRSAKKNIREKDARKKLRASKRYRKDRPIRLDIGRPTTFGRFSPEPNYLAALPGLKRPFRGKPGRQHERERRRKQRDRRRRRRVGRRERVSRRRNRDRKRTRNLNKADDIDLTSSDSVSDEESDAADDTQLMEDSDSDEDLGDEGEEKDVGAEEEDMAEIVDFDEDEITEDDLTEDDLTKEDPVTAVEEYESNEDNMEAHSSFGAGGNFYSKNDLPGFKYDGYGGGRYPY